MARTIIRTVRSYAVKSFWLTLLIFAVFLVAQVGAQNKKAFSKKAILTALKEVKSAQAAQDLIALIKESGVNFVLTGEVEKELRDRGAMDNVILALRLNYRTTSEIELVYIPPGTFMMGAAPGEFGSISDEGPARKITIREGFLMGKYEVTQQEYERVTKINPSGFRNCPRCPVEQLSWNDAKEFVRLLNNRKDGFKYRLPSEAEWEYAARAGTTTTFAFGDTLNSAQANFDGNNPYGKTTKGRFLEKTTPVGSFQPNAFGLFDMHGNVWEWVEDVYTSNYTGLSNNDSANTTVGDTNYRAVRGGSWIGIGGNCRSANRGKISANNQLNDLGFRVVAIANR